MGEFEDWTRAFSFLIWDGTQWVKVLGAADGSLYAVLQGDYEGTLTTVALDAEGRLSAFIVDNVDVWGRLIAVGNSELAARLGSPVRFDRRGQVLWMDSFETGMQRWQTSVSEASGSVALDPTAALTGGYSVKMTAGAGAADNARMYHYSGIRPEGKVGLSVAFALDTTIDRIEFHLTYGSTTEILYPAIRWDDSTDQLEYLDSANAWQSIGSFKPTTRGAYNWNLLKFVADLEAEEYVRLLVNEQEHDLSGTAIRKVVSTPTPAYFVDIWLYSRDDTNDWCNIDDVILTVAEPA